MPILTSLLVFVRISRSLWIAPGARGPLKSGREPRRVFGLLGGEGEGPATSTGRLDGTCVTARHTDDKHPKPHDWGVILRTQEAWIFGIGILCAGTIVLWLFELSGSETGKGAAALAVITTHLTGGRAMGVTAALDRGFKTWEAITLGSLIEASVVCFFFSVFSLSFKKLITVRFLDSAMANVHRSAENQRRHILRWGIPGLLMFVWFPFFMTGPVVGSVIGYLLGMRPWVVVTVVLTGTVSAVVSWTVALKPLVEWARAVGEFVPLMIVFILLVLIGSYRLSKYLDAQAKKNGNGNGNGDPGTDNSDTAESADAVEAESDMEGDGK